MTKKIFQRILGNELEGPIEAGRTLGMPVERVIEKYFTKRNDLMTLLRIYSNLSLADVAGELGVTEKELESVISSNELVPFQWVPKLAKLFKVDLKTLLVVFGHARGEGHRIEGEKQAEELRLAAQYSGPELSTQEKVDLKELVKLILDNLKNRNNNPKYS